MPQTIRRRDLTLPGRITGSGRRCTLHLRPWHEGFTLALSRLRALPLLGLSGRDTPSVEDDYHPRHADRSTTCHHSLRGLVSRI